MNPVLNIQSFPASIIMESFAELTSLIWRFNIEVSLLLLAVLLARTVLRRSAKIYNAYLLWAVLPLGVTVAYLVRLVPLAEPPLPVVNNLVQEYVVRPEAMTAVVPNTFLSELFVLWIVVALLMLIRLSIQHFKLRRELRALAVPFDEYSSSRFAVVGVNQPDLSPAVYGFFRPKIYFPVHLLDELSTQQIELILRHEEHHIRQGHLWLNLLWDVLVCLFWFNPLVYLSRQRFRHDQELFCDYLVLEQADSDAQKTYGHALLSTVTATHSVSLLCSWSAFNQLEERIMNIKKPNSLFGRALLAFSAALLIASASFYSVNAHEYKHVKDHDTTGTKFHIQNFNDSWRVEWLQNGKQLMRDNDTYYAVQEGQKRAMTDVERRQFEKRFQAVRERHKNEALLEKIQRKTERERERHQAELERHQAELEKHQLESDRHQADAERRKELERVRVKTRFIEKKYQKDDRNQQHNLGTHQFGSQQLEEAAAHLENNRLVLERAKTRIAESRKNLERSYQQRQVSKREVTGALRGLESAERKLAKEQKRLNIEAKRAKVEMRRIEAQIERAERSAKKRKLVDQDQQVGVIVIPKPSPAPRPATVDPVPIATPQPPSVELDLDVPVSSKDRAKQKGNKFDIRKAH